MKVRVQIPSLSNPKTLLDPVTAMLDRTALELFTTPTTTSSPSPLVPPSKDAVLAPGVIETLPLGFTVST